MRIGARASRHAAFASKPDSPKPQRLAGIAGALHAPREALQNLDSAPVGKPANRARRTGLTPRCGAGS
jgi:hypothetical protein